MQGEVKLTVTVPGIGWSSPMIKRIVVDSLAPFRPRNPVTVPGAMVGMVSLVLSADPPLSRCPYTEQKMTKAVYSLWGEARPAEPPAAGMAGPGRAISRSLDIHTLSYPRRGD